MRDDVDLTLHRPRSPGAPNMTRCGVFLEWFVVGPTEFLAPNSRRLCPECWPEA